MFLFDEPWLFNFVILSHTNWNIPVVNEKKCFSNSYFHTVNSFQFSSISLNPSSSKFISFLGFEIIQKATILMKS